VNNRVEKLVAKAKRRQKIKHILLCPMKLDWYKLTIIVLLALILEKIGN